MIKVDFERFFPHKFWISTWGKDSAYPDGFRYKILSARDEKQQTIEVVLLLEKSDGEKVEMLRSEPQLNAIDGYARVYWRGLEDEYQIEFEEQDYSAIRTAEEFEDAVASHGWSSSEPGKEQLHSKCLFAGFSRQLLCPQL